jgi:hypothetical protein
MGAAIRYCAGMSTPQPAPRAWATPLIVAALPLLALVLMHRLHGVQISLMTRDPTGIAGVHPLSGILSSLGVLLWWSAASVWIFSTLLHRATGDAPKFRFALASGALSMYFGLDDLFQFHERLAPQHLGIPERVVLGTIVLLAALYLLSFRREILRAHGRLLVLAVCFLAASVLFDTLLASWAWRLKGWTYFFEDGSKWVGIVFWCGFAVTRCRADLLDLRHAHARAQ